MKREFTFLPCPERYLLFMSGTAVSSGGTVSSRSGVQVTAEQNRHPALIVNSCDFRNFREFIGGGFQQTARLGDPQPLEPVAECIAGFLPEQVQKT